MPIRFLSRTRVRVPEASWGSTACSLTLASSAKLARRNIENGGVGAIYSAVLNISNGYELYLFGRIDPGPKYVT
jgi:hypothetical protein